MISKITNEFILLKDQLNLPRSVIYDAYDIFKNIPHHMFMGRKIQLMLGTCVYISCRNAEIPIHIIEISSIFGVRELHMERSFRFILNGCGLNVKPINPINYVYRATQNLKVSDKVKTDSIDILKRVHEKGGLCGKNPFTILASSIYLACIENCEYVTPDSIAHESGITLLSLTNTYKIMKEMICVNPKINMYNN